MSTLAFDGHTPAVHPESWIADSAMIIGRVSIAASASVFYGAVVRGDSNSIEIGEGTNLQDNVVVHADPGFPTRVGAGISVGHGAVLHGCTIGDRTLVGMNATVLNGAVVGEECLIAAGALVLEGAEIPPRSLVAGVPGKVRRELTADEIEHVRQNAVGYQETARKHAEANRIAAADAR
jgi:carbonic anhydrase/acetyltransferase-like protein (isoleucine patch superfamily)